MGIRFSPSGFARQFGTDLRTLTCRPGRGAPGFSERALALDRIAGSSFLACIAVVLFWLALEIAPLELPIVPDRAEAAASGAASLPELDAAEAARPLSGADVRRLQRRLRALGFDPGAIDGLAGPRTLGALNQYRSAKGLGRVARIERETVADLLD